MLGIAKVVHEMKEGMIYFRVGPFRHIVAAMNAKTAEVSGAIGSQVWFICLFCQTNFVGN